MFLVKIPDLKSGIEDPQIVKIRFLDFYCENNLVFLIKK